MAQGSRKRPVLKLLAKKLPDDNVVAGELPSKVSECILFT